MGRLISAALLLAVSACGNPVQTCNLAPAVMLDADFDSLGTPFVMAGVNNVAAAMTFDTGSTTTLVTPELAKQAGLSYSLLAEEAEFVGAGETFNAWQTNVKRFQLGSALGLNFGFFVANLDGPQEAADFGSDMDGDLGEDILNNYDIDLDLPDGKISLYDPTGCAASGPPWSGPADAIPIQKNWAGIVFLPVTVDGVSMPAFLDTGTAFTTIPAYLFQSLGRQAGMSKPIQTIASLTIGGVYIKEQLYPVKNFMVGNTPFENAAVAVPATRLSAAKMQKLGQILLKMESKNPNFPSVITDGLGISVTLGDDFIRAHRMFISSSTNMLYVKN